MTIGLAMLAAVALVVALLAFAAARRAARRVEQLQESYWELRYEHGRLRAQVKRLDPEAPDRDEPATTDLAATDPSTTFIPLSSLKR